METLSWEHQKTVLKIELLTCSFVSQNNRRDKLNLKQHNKFNRRYAGTVENLNV